jgi:hypothetical protein
MPLNRALLHYARSRFMDKAALVPSDAAMGGDPAAGGMPPGGGGPMAAMGGGPAPGGMPPPGGGGDPMAAMGGMPPPPPTDPSTGQPGAAGNDLSTAVQTAMTNVLSQAGLLGGGPDGKGGKQTAPKPDINTIATDVFQLKKMLLHVIRAQGMELPPDVLDGPNRDPSTGAPAAAPDGGSVVRPGASATPSQGASPDDSAIKPVEPCRAPSPPRRAAPKGRPNGKAGRAWSPPLPFSATEHALAVARLFRSRRAAG